MQLLKLIHNSYKAYKNIFQSIFCHVFEMHYKPWINVYITATSHPNKETQSRYISFTFFTYVVKICAYLWYLLIALQLDKWDLLCYLNFFFLNLPISSNFARSRTRLFRSCNLKPSCLLCDSPLILCALNLLQIKSILCNQNSQCRYLCEDNWCWCNNH